MAIQSREDLRFYLLADTIALGRQRIGIIRRIILPDYIALYLKYLRNAEYYTNIKPSILSKFLMTYYKFRLYRLGSRLGFSIPLNVVGPGLRLPHIGTVIINNGAKIGANCTIHVGVNIGTAAGFSSKAPLIGDNVYIGPGAKLFGEIIIASNVAIGANAVVNKSFYTEGIAIAGVPAKQIGSINVKEILVQATRILELNISPDEIIGLPAMEVQKRLREHGY